MTYYCVYTNAVHIQRVFYKKIIEPSVWHLISLDLNPVEHSVT